MANLLSFLKEKGISQLEAIEILSKIDNEPEAEIAVEEPIEEEEDPDGALYITEMPKEDETEPEPEEEEEDTIIQLTPEELAAKIAEAVEDSKKSKRAPPSKGKRVDRPMIVNKDTGTERPRNWFERIV